MKREDLPERILVVGLGRTGVALIRFLAKMGIRPKVTDLKKEGELESQLEEIRGIEFDATFGGHRKEDFLESDLIIVSPGVDMNLPYLLEAKKMGVKVTGELEFASRFVDEPIIAVTGTNGKTTVTTLIGKIFKEAFGDVFVGGNIGNPLIEYVTDEKKASFVILEVSSFQLETIEKFRPRCALLLNVTEDHLDRYKDFCEYLESKLKIFENQKEEDVAVVNRKITLKNRPKSKTLFFSLNERLEEGAFFREGEIVVRIGGTEYKYKRSISPLFGMHNTENLLASILVAHIYGIERDVIVKSISEFKGLPHRTEFVREIDGVVFINDSKATNVDATKRAIESIEKKIILIAGGKDKMGSYRPILSEKRKIKALVLFGESKERIKKEIGDSVTCFMEIDLDRAVKKAYELSEKGDVILFSPMCSSFDMFKNYAERGERFKQVVSTL
jgi:UDP-N-acetylmuramoylalanine--D-glutamate ligase